MAIWSLMYQAENRSGNRAVAREALREAEAVLANGRSELILWHVVVGPAISDDTATQGNLASAEQVCQRFLDNLPSSLQISRGKYETCLLSIYLEQNRLHEVGALAPVLQATMERRPTASGSRRHTPPWPVTIWRSISRSSLSPCSNAG
ncbi:MAG: hypothetical protein QM692_01370 [Thermomicrobiales bacterium]